MIDDEDDELEEILKKKRERLLKKKKEFESINMGNSAKTNGETIENPIKVVYSYLNDAAKRYLDEKIDEESKPKVLDSLLFLIKYGLVEKPLNVEAVAYISRRVLGTDYKIFVEKEGEYEEI
ncbi:MAG: hypothetical protein ACP6IP_00665 [Candidatus Njordarchaeia archaeon]